MKERARIAEHARILATLEDDEVAALIYASRENARALAWEEYDAAADWVARRHPAGDIGSTPLPELLSALAFRYISSDPDAFAARVNTCRYQHAMEAHNAPDPD